MKGYDVEIKFGTLGSFTEKQLENQKSVTVEKVCILDFVGF